MEHEHTYSILFKGAEFQVNTQYVSTIGAFHYVTVFTSPFILLFFFFFPEQLDKQTS